MGKKQWRKDLPVKEEKILQDNKIEDPDKNRIGFAKLISNQFIFINGISFAYVQVIVITIKLFACRLKRQQDYCFFFFYYESFFCKIHKGHKTSYKQRQNAPM